MNSRKPKRRTDMPNDLVTEILEWLPVRSLVRFKCVSKWFYDLITSPTPTFINNHHLKGRRRKMLLLRRCLTTPQEDDDDVLSIHNMDSSQLEIMQPNLSISFINDLSIHKKRPCHILGPCNGIVCIFNYTSVVLCNPALREFKILPPIPSDCPPGYAEYVLCRGFGVTSSGEFKVILNGNNVEYGSSRFTPFPVQLYSSSTNSWKQIDKFPADPWPKRPGDHVFFNGACHWTAATHAGFNPNLILSFDMNDEVFRQLELPDCLIKCEGMIRLIVVNECLAIVQHQSWTEVHSSEVVEIWVMEKYGVKESWTFQYQIWPYLYVCPFLSWKNDEWLLLETSHGQLASISFHTNEVKKFEIYGVQNSIRALIYEESLVILK